MSETNKKGATRTMTADDESGYEEQDVLNWMTDRLLIGSLVPDVDDLVNRYPMDANEAFVIRTRWMVMALSGLGMLEGLEKQDSALVHERGTATVFGSHFGTMLKKVAEHDAAKGKPVIPRTGGGVVRCAFCEVLLMDSKAPRAFKVGEFPEDGGEECWHDACGLCASKASKGEKLKAKASECEEVAE